MHRDLSAHYLIGKLQADLYISERFRAQHEVDRSRVAVAQNDRTRFYEVGCVLPYLIREHRLKVRTCGLRALTVCRGDILQSTVRNEHRQFGRIADLSIDFYRFFRFGFYFGKDFRRFRSKIGDNDPAVSIEYALAFCSGRLIFCFKSKHRFCGKSIVRKFAAFGSALRRFFRVYGKSAHLKRSGIFRCGGSFGKKITRAAFDILSASRVDSFGIARAVDKVCEILQERGARPVIRIGRFRCVKRFGISRPAAAFVLSGFERFFLIDIRRSIVLLFFCGIFCCVDCLFFCGIFRAVRFTFLYRIGVIVPPELHRILSYGIRKSAFVFMERMHA